MSSEEDRLRAEIRRELEEEESRRRAAEEEKRAHERLLEEQRMRQRIREEEKQRLFQDSGEHQRYVNEEGEVEWLTSKQIQRREGYFDYEEKVEDIEGGRRTVLRRWFAGGLVLCLLGWLAWTYIQPDRATLDVVSNIPGAAIWVDGQFSGEQTDARLDLAAGEHFVEVRLPGYRCEGGLQHTRLDGGEHQVLSFRLVADPAATEP